jgi:Rrf2 family nitric oxide-sensitive transcriptional repressor
MHLTTFGDYTLCTLINYLALRLSDLCTIDAIAAAYGISASHLMTVVHQATQTAHPGGLRLVRAPGMINLGTVVRRTEPDLHIVPCFGAGAACYI